MSFPTDSKDEAGPAGYNNTPIPSTALLEMQDGDRSRRRRRRFFHLTAFSLVALWFFTSDYPTSVINWRAEEHPHRPHHLPPGVKVHECVSWRDTANNGDFPHFASGNLTVDSASDLLFLARGQLSFGSFELSQSKEYNEGKVGVQLSVGYNRPHFLDVAKVCVISRGKSKGVGILTPERTGRHHPRGWSHPEFKVRVDLPAGDKEKGLVIESLVADLPLFKQEVEGLGETVYFDKFHLASVNGLIGVESVTGNDITVSTVNAAITGSFKADKALALETVNAPITAQVVINHPGDPNHVTNSAFHSTSGDIEVKAKLTAAGKNADAKLSLYAHTVRGAIDVEVEESPLDARATIEADTVTSGISISMPPTFEGYFNLETLVGKATVTAPEVEDPSGRGRKRDVTIKNPNWKTVEGSVLWSEEAKNIGGSVLLKSTTGSLKLQL